MTVADSELFGDTTNFELVLGDLNTASRVGSIVGVDTSLFLERYRSIQRALGNGIREVHVTRSQVPNSALATIRSTLTAYASVFSTSYDLLLYWAMGYGGRFQPFTDFFRGPGLAFNPDRTVVMENQIPVFFLHGALHLFVSGRGVTRKVSRTTARTLLEQIGQPVEDDPQARPLLITEGSPQGKRRAIESNAYLSHALRRLREREGPAVVFGSRLGGEDAHLSEALNEHPDRTIAVSMTPGTRRALAPRQVAIYARLRTDTLLFFDSTTHPLGSSELRVQIRDL